MPFGQLDSSPWLRILQYMKELAKTRTTFKSIGGPSTTRGRDSRLFKLQLGSRSRGRVRVQDVQRDLGDCTSQVHS